jgi:riboflavin-specific deaminase-like protein
VTANSKKTGAKRPFVFVNMAMTADGKIATANRAVHSFGSPRDLAHLYELRATADAILCGARTVEISESLLGNGGEKFRRLRLQHQLAEHPLRVLVTGSGSINPDAPIFQQRFSPIIVLTTRSAPAGRLKKLRAVADEVKMFGDSRLDFRAALRWLKQRRGVNRLLCEGGGELNDALFRAGLVDEIHLTICPQIFGGRAAPTIADGQGFARLKNAEQFELTSRKVINGELFTAFKKLNSGSV